MRPATDRSLDRRDASLKDRPARDNYANGDVMILGLSIATFTKLHVAISLIGIVSGLVVLYGMLGAQRMPGWTALFLVATVLTSVTGFMFPAVSITPAAIFGAISLVVLAVALLALYVFHANGAWRWIYVVTALVALYLNVFVPVVQAFQKIAVLHPLAPNGSGPPFLVAQTIVLLTFLWLGFGAVRKFRPEAMAPARR
jgi:hypothetical protein